MAFTCTSFQSRTLVKERFVYVPNLAPEIDGLVEQAYCDDLFDIDGLCSSQRHTFGQLHGFESWLVESFGYFLILVLSAGIYGAALFPFMECWRFMIG